MRVIVEPVKGVRNAHLHQHLPRQGARGSPLSSLRSTFLQAKDFGAVLRRHQRHIDQLLTDTEGRVQVGGGVLKNHADATAAQAAHRTLIKRQQVLPIEQNLAAAVAPGRRGHKT